jgi:hypothetical protein
MNDDKNANTAEHPLDFLVSLPPCPTGSYAGQPCQCAGCFHTDNVCIHIDAGSGCASCDGPVTGCDVGSGENGDAK